MCIFYYYYGSNYCIQNDYNIILLLYAMAVITKHYSYVPILYIVEMLFLY